MFEIVMNCVEVLQIAINLTFCFKFPFFECSPYTLITNQLGESYSF